MYLLTGQTLLAKSIRVATVKLYLKAVADYFLANEQFNPTLDQKGGKLPTLESIYHEGNRWEKMPNRSEPMTPEMVQFLYNLGQNSPFNSAIAAYADWAVLSLHAGFRISEYAQTHSAQHMSLDKQISLNLDGTSKAFIASDFKFLGPHCRPLAKNKRVTEPFVHITWRFQKNGNNGEEIAFARSDSHPYICPVKAAYRIIKRSENLRQQAHLPIAVCISPNKKLASKSYLTSSFVAKMLKFSATKVHGLTAKEDLKKFTPHSPRVGACVMLDMLRHKPDFIKKRLRWASDSYRDYLRHIPTVASAHTEAISSYFSKESA